MASSAENQSTLTLDNVFSYAEFINNYSDLSLNQNPTNVISKSKPIVDVTFPKNNEAILGNALIDSSSNAYVKVTVEDVSGIQFVDIVINHLSGAFQTELQVTKFNLINVPFDSLSIPDGKYVINVSATNVLGRTTNFSPINISIGNNIISAKINKPDLDVAYGGPIINVTGNVNNPSVDPLEYIELRLDTNLLALEQSIDLASKTNIIKTTIDSLTKPGLSDGPHKLELIAKSIVANRESGIDSVIFYVDNTNPTATLSQQSSIQKNHVFTQAGTFPILYNLNDPVDPTTNYSSGLN